jgi:hypothetical protein
MKTEPYYIPSSLLTTRNVKTVKGEKLGWKTYILYMSPYNQNSQKKNICPMATEGCSTACLFSSGKGGIDTVRNGRTNKTEFFLHNRELFLKTIYSEIAQIEVKHKIEGGDFTIRLNGTSDISWENFKIKDGKNIFELFPNIQFYDYTKNYLRFKPSLPKNYYLMFSRSEKNDAIAMDLLKKGINVSIVFDKVPTSYMGYKVIDGDENDLRHLDKQGVIVGLRYKKVISKGFDNDIAFKSGFAIRTQTTAVVKPKLKKAA